MKTLKLNADPAAIAAGIGMSGTDRGGEPGLPGTGPQPRPEDLPASTATGGFVDVDAAETQRNRLEAEQAAGEAQALAANKAQADRNQREDEEAARLVQLNADEKNDRFHKNCQFAGYHAKWLAIVAEAENNRTLADAADARAKYWQIMGDGATGDSIKAHCSAMSTQAGREYHLYRLLEGEAKEARNRLEGFPRV